MDSEYYKIRNTWRKVYKTFSPIQSAALNSEITFNSKGFMHIVYEKGNTERERAAQITRFNLLQDAYDLVKLANIFQEYEFDIEKNIYY
jgi:hypothetical protein